MTTSNGRRFRRALYRRLLTRRESNERGKDTVIVVRALQIHAQRCAVACIISYQTAKETTCMQCPSYAVS